MLNNEHEKRCENRDVNWTASSPMKHTIITRNPQCRIFQKSRKISGIKVPEVKRLIRHLRGKLKIVQFLVYKLKNTLYFDKNESYEENTSYVETRFSNYVGILNQVNISWKPLQIFN